jgi:hypothetical protein
MKSYLISVVSILCALISCDSTGKIEAEVNTSNAPALLAGYFEDDYEIRYSITDSTFILLPDDIYHIEKWNIDKQYLIAQNDSSNSYDPGLWSRIDWIHLSEMDPYTWAFCLSVYNAESAIKAEESAEINAESPKTGCNGYPFSRMKPIEMPNSTMNSY